MTVNWKIGSHSFHISLTMLALGVGALLVYAHSGNATGADQWTASVRQELATSRAWQARAASLNGQAAHARAAAAFFQDSMGTLEDVFDSLVAAAQKPGTVVTVTQIGVACHDALDVCKLRGDSLAKADSLDRAQALANFARAQRADSLLRQGTTIVDCRVLFLKCPSRTQAFEAGSGLTAVLFVVLRAARIF